MIRKILTYLLDQFSMITPRADPVKAKGRVMWKVIGPDGEIKAKGESRNIVTDEGDALIADLMSDSPARNKVDSTNGHIEVGTGFVSESKSAEACTTPTGSPEVMDSGYPQTKGAWGAADDNVTVFKVTFEAGDLDATGIDEAALLNASIAATADCLAYAQISPAVDVSSSDTLEITWELTFTGS